VDFQAINFQALNLYDRHHASANDEHLQEYDRRIMRHLRHQLDHCGQYIQIILLHLHVPLLDKVRFRSQ
jgi:hypothetical protein